MRLTLISPVSALWRSACLMGVVYLLSMPQLAPLRPDPVDGPMSRYHAAVNSLFRDTTPSLAVVTDPLRMAPVEARKRFDAMLKR